MKPYNIKTVGIAALLALIISGQGCSPIPNDGVPIYIQVDSPTVVIDGPFGSASQRIVDVWAETGNHNLGAYEMPVKIPVLAQGDVPFIFSAGILDNGTVDARAEYPFYRPDTFTLYNAIPGHTYIHHPVYHYFARTNVALNEDFEGLSNSFSGLAITNVTADSAVFEGNHSATIALGTNDTVKFATQAIPVTITTNGRQAYLELNYKSGLWFDIGIRENTGTGSTATFTDIPLVTLVPQSHWHKSYINLSTAIGSYPGAGFQLYFIAYNSLGSAGNLYIDNIKILYFN